MCVHHTWGSQRTPFTLFEAEPLCHLVLYAPCWLACELLGILLAPPPSHHSRACIADTRHHIWLSMGSENPNSAPQAYTQRVRALPTEPSSQCLLRSSVIGSFLLTSLCRLGPFSLNSFHRGKKIIVQIDCRIWPKSQRMPGTVISISLFLR